MHLVQPDGDCFHFAGEPGLVEVTEELGTEAQTGQLLARLWSSSATARDVFANCDGILIAKHFPGLVQEGDCLAVLAVPTVGG